MEIGERIRAARKKAGLTQKALGERCHMPDSQIRQYELGMVNPKMDTLRRIASALGVGLDSFIELNMDGEGGLARTGLDAQERLLGDLPRNRGEIEDWKERVLIESFRRLNALGKEKAIEELEDLGCIPKYTEVEG